MENENELSRRDVLGRLAAAAGGACSLAAAAHCGGLPAAHAADEKKEQAPAQGAMPCGTIGKAKISRLMLGGNLVSGCMHSRDLHYVGPLFRAYMTEQKILETFKLAEQHGINTVLESGAALVQKYNKECGGHMQIIPSIHPSQGQPEREIKDEIKHWADFGVPAVYVWGVAGDTLVRAGEIDRIAKAVELAKAQGLPAGVGGHSLQVPVACEKHKVPCDFYVKTFHADGYPSATPKPLRKEYGWLDGGPGWYDNMWCINPEETAEFMKSVAKPWIAFKVLAAGSILPRQGFSYAFNNGADFIGVGMFDFQIAQNCELAAQAVRRAQQRPRPWRA
jgi:hypothetical protein